MSVTKPKNWRKVKLGEVADLNPIVRLKKGKNYSFIPMEIIDGANKYIKPNTKKRFDGGGTKFNEGDVLFARITPCLEHGKVAVVKGLEEGTGFGSTEYFIFRGKENVTDTNFLYYLSKINKFKQTAINSMVGASGRQRARIEALQNYELNLPTILEQKRIAGILSAFDDKIELNNKINHNLEQTAQAIFKEWFASPSVALAKEGKLPKGWEAKKITEIIKRLPVGKKYDNKNALPKGEIPVLDQGQSGFIGYHNGEPGVKASIENPVVVFTNHTCYYRLLTHDFSCIQNVLPYVGINGYPTLFVYFLTKGKIKMQEYKGHWPEFEEQIFTIPPVLLAQKFSDYIQPMIRKMVEIENENQKLSSLRDLLLPKLMSGEIRV